MEDRLMFVHRYSITDATWTLPDDLGNGDVFIEQFMIAVKEEGLDISDPYKNVVLAEAVTVGW